LLAVGELVRHRICATLGEQRPPIHGEQLLLDHAPHEIGGLRPPEVRRVVELKQSMIVKAGDAVVNPVCCLKARRRTYMLT
jgi:hypothetical protein